MTIKKRRTFKIFTTLLKLLRMRSYDIILEYYDVSVYKSDFDNLRQDQWFNDNNLTFWYEYLERSDAFTSIPHPEQIVLLRPSMVFLLAQSDNPRELKEVLPNFDMTRFIFLPINNNTDADLAEGGSHWSLLIVDKQMEKAYYYDTLDDINLQDAEIVCRKLVKLLGCGSMLLRSIPSPQQTNGSDCGVMVCMLTSHLLQKIIDAQKVPDALPNMYLDDCILKPSRDRQLMSYTILDLISKFGRKIGDQTDIEIKPLGPSHDQQNSCNDSGQSQLSSKESSVSADVTSSPEMKQVPDSALAPDAARQATHSPDQNSSLD